MTDGMQTYRIGPDGQRELMYHNNFHLEIDGKTYLDLDEKTGILKLSMSPSDLEDFAGALGEIPDSGLKMTIPTPFEGPVYLEGVKSIESIMNEEGNYIMQLHKEQEEQPAVEFEDKPQEEGLLKKLGKFIGR